METPFSTLKFAGFDFTSASSIVVIDGSASSLDWKPAAPGRWTADIPAGKFTLTVTDAGGRVTVKAAADLTTPAHDMRFTLLRAAVPADHLLSHGARMGRCQLLKTPKTEAVEFESYLLTVLTRGNRQLMISTPLEMEHFCCVRGRVEGELVNLSLDCDTKEFGDCHCDVAAYTFAIGGAVEMMREYGKAQVEIKRDFTTPPALGWNSWDYYRWTITEDEVLANAEFIARDPVLSCHIKRIIVDDGWQNCYGEWDANIHFASGMPHLAAELTKMGFEPGLWFAPAIVEPFAHIAQWDYGMLAQSRGGQPCLGFECMRRFGFLLDPTVEKSRKFLHDLFDRYAGYGFKYFKLDFLFALLSGARFSDPTVPRAKLVGKLLEPIYDGINGRSAILGCNYPFMTGNRFVEAVRVGSDIHARWTGIKLNAISIAARFWSNKVLWLNDPDFAVCRGVDTSDDPDIARLQACYAFVKPDDAVRPDAEYPLATATRDEIEVLLSLNMMAGGAVNFSDKMPLLNALGLEMARKVASAESGAAALPLDLFESEHPALWQQELPSGGRRILAINWSDVPAEISLTRAEKPASRCRDFWRDIEIAAPNEVVLAPHSCRLLVWSK